MYSIPTASTANFTIITLLRILNQFLWAEESLLLISSCDIIGDHKINCSSSALSHDTMAVLDVYMSRQITI